MHYEVERAGLGHEHGPDVGTHAEPERWHVVDVVNADAVLMPLRFDTLEQALAYVARTPGTLRIVEVTDEGERLSVDSYFVALKLKSVTGPPPALLQAKKLPPILSTTPSVPTQAWYT